MSDQASQRDRDPRVLTAIEFEWWGGDTAKIVAARARRAQDIARERAPAAPSPQASRIAAAARPARSRGRSR